MGHREAAVAMMGLGGGREERGQKEKKLACFMCWGTSTGSSHR